MLPVTSSAGDADLYDEWRAARAAMLLSREEVSAAGTAAPDDLFMDFLLWRAVILLLSGFFFAHCAFSPSRGASRRAPGMMHTFVWLHAGYDPSGICSGWKNNVTVGLHDQSGVATLIVKSIAARSPESRGHHDHRCLHTPHRSHPIMCFISSRKFQGTTMTRKQPR